MLTSRVGTLVDFMEHGAADLGRAGSRADVSSGRTMHYYLLVGQCSTSGSRNSSTTSTSMLQVGVGACSGDDNDDDNLKQQCEQ